MSISIKVDQKEFPKFYDLVKSKQKETIMNALKIGYQVMYPDNKIDSTNNYILNKLNLLENNVPNIEELNKTITKLLGISNNSSLKGELGENLIEELVKERYQFGEYQVTRSIPHSGDGILVLPNKNRVIFEVKNYQITVPEKEVEKMRNDMKFQKIRFGVMVSVASKILNTKNIDLETFSENNEIYYLLKINHLTEDTSRLESTLNILDELIKINQDNKTQIIKEEDFKKNINSFVNKFNENLELRESFLEMENNIKLSLEGFYGKMRNLQMEQEILLQQLVKKIEEEQIQIVSIPNNIKEFEENKIYPQLLKLMDLFRKNQITSTLKKNKLIFENGEVKITKEKLGITIINPSLTLNITYKDDNSKNWKLLTTLLE